MFILIIHRGNIFTQVKMTWTRCCEAGELAVAKSAKSAKFTVYFFAMAMVDVMVDFMPYFSG